MNPASVTLRCDFIKTGLPHRHFPRNVPMLFRDSRFIKQVLATASLYLFSEPDNYYLVGLHKGNSRNISE